MEFIKDQKIGVIRPVPALDASAIFVEIPVEVARPLKSFREGLCQRGLPRLSWTAKEDHLLGVVETQWFCQVPHMAILYCTT